MENELLSEIYLEVGEGWKQLLQDLCTEIDAVYKRAELPMDISVEQVKSKYGEFRFYYSHENDMGEESEDCLKLYDEVRRIVEKWEAKSKNVCERCGEQGSLHNISGWREVLCDDCLENRNVS